MWAKDASAWKTDPAAVKIIENALGWLTVPEVVKPHAGELKAFADEIAKAGFQARRGHGDGRVEPLRRGPPQGQPQGGRGVPDPPGPG